MKNLSRNIRGGKRIAEKAVLYFILIGIGLVFIYPIMYMTVNSFKSTADLVNPTIEWVPTQLFFENYKKAMVVLDFWKSLTDSLFLTVASAVLQTTVCALTGYAFARHIFPLKKLWFVLAVGTFIIPAQVTLIPKYILFNNYGIIGGPFSLFLPAALAQGVRSAIFILVFHQFFRSYPKSFDEAAKLDGAGRLSVFIKIAIPLCVPAIILSMLLSFVWYWNETFESALFLGEAFRTLPLGLKVFASDYGKFYSSDPKSDIDRINEGIRMAATILTIIPLMTLYVFLQKHFIEGIEASGLTGE